MVDSAGKSSGFRSPTLKGWRPLEFFHLALPSMKLSGFILAIYMVVLAVIPCCVWDDCPDDKAITEQSAQHENGDDDCGTCSPFFNCGGCATASVNFQLTSFTLHSPSISKIYTGFLQPYFPEVHYDFWQPPRPV